MLHKLIVLSLVFVAATPVASFAQVDSSPGPAAAGSAERAGAPVEPVFISNVPEVAQSLPEPVPLTDTSAPRDRAGASHKPLAIVFDVDALRRYHRLALGSSAAIVVDQEEGRLLFAKNADAVRPIASITKLMTAMVVLDSGLPLDEDVIIKRADVHMPTTRVSQLRPGMLLTRRELLRLALMASENPAAAALARSYPGGTPAFVQAMNAKAAALSMRDTRFLEPTGLNHGNVSSAYDLALMVDAGYTYPLIREFTTSESHDLPLVDRRRITRIAFYNSNDLVRSGEWQIGLSKTGFINEAGRCLVMQATIESKPVIIVLLDSNDPASRTVDANRIKRALEGADLGDTAPERQKRRM